MQNGVSATRVEQDWRYQTADLPVNVTGIDGKHTAGYFDVAAEAADAAMDSVKGYMVCTLADCVSHHTYWWPSFNRHTVFHATSPMFTVLWQYSVFFKTSHKML